MTPIQLVWFILGFIVVIGVVFGVFMFFWSRTFKWKFRIYENTSGTGHEELGLVRGRLLRIPGSLSEKVYYIPKLKEYVSAYGRKMGKNMYYLFKGQDGYFYNCTLGDMDAKTGTLDIEPVNSDVRAFHTTNNKNIRDRYDKPKNWPLVLMSFTIIIALLIVFIGGYVLFNKMNEGIDKVNQAQGIALERDKESVRVLAIIDSAQSKFTGSSSGLEEATDNG